MMTRMTAEMKRIFEQMNDKQKIRMFYELGKYIISKVDENVEDKDMQYLLDDIANVVNDVENL